MPRSFWFYAIRHAAQMMNYAPGRLKNCLTTPFELVHNKKPDGRIFFDLFSTGYFNKQRDGPTLRTTTQAHTLQGIAVGRCPKSNGLEFYNPSTRSIYTTADYRLDPGRHTINEFGLKYDGGIFVGLYSNNSSPVAEPYPPGTRLRFQHPTKPLQSGTITAIPLGTATPLTPCDDKYLITLDDGSTLSLTLDQLDPLIIPPPATPAPSPDSLLPVWLQHGSKISYDKDGEYHKCQLIQSPTGMWRISMHKPRSKKELWGVDLPDFTSTYLQLIDNETILPGWQISSFLRSPHRPSASHVSAKTLSGPAPTSLRNSIHPSNPDRDVWRASYDEEIDGLNRLGTYDELSYDEYKKLRSQGAPKAIPTMCVQVIKKDEDFNPDRAKSRIVVLGNHESRYWSNAEKFAPVLSQMGLRILTSIAVQHKRRLKTG
jgi:hypothetical protein